MHRFVAIAISAVAALAAAAPAQGHHPESDGLDPLEVASAHHQHGDNDGHLPAERRNVDVVGKLDLFGDDERPSRIADVAAHGNYAYLGAFYEPDCEDGGVYVVDISNPSKPREAGFIPASPFTYVGEGVQVLDMRTPAFKGQVLIHNNENCSPVEGGLPAGPGGASLWDVTDPTEPQPLAEHVGDEDQASDGSLPHTSLPHQSHSAFGWQQGDRAYLVMVDNAELGVTDIDILDITDPRDPQLIVETGMKDFKEIAEEPPPNGNNAFLHDMVVKKVGSRFLLLGSYWDGGYITLDVTDLPEKPTLVGHTDFGATEPFAERLGLPARTSPEGNAHQAEFNHASTMFLGADEDFGPYRVLGQVMMGRYAGDVFSATQGSDVPQLDDKTTIRGPVDYVGNACTPLPPVTPSEGRVALTERGPCTFTIKVQNIQAAGYQAGIVFNDRESDPDCDAQVTMLAVGDIPFVFVGRSAGLKLLDVPFEDPCQTDAPTAAEEQGIEMTAAFDGWGYLHLYDADTMKALDHWALPESLAAENATGKGDLSIHEVAMDPKENRAYISHYSGGFRVVDFSREDGIREVGAYIAEGGNNFWGVETHSLPGGSEPIVLASDRDSGLWIFRYSPEPSAPTAGETPRTRGVRFAFRGKRRMSRRGVVRVPLRCPASETDGCEGRLKMRRGGRVIAKRGYEIAAGHKRVVRLRVKSRRARRSIRQTRRPRALLRAVDREGPRTWRRVRIAPRRQAG